MDKPGGKAVASLGSGLSLASPRWPRGAGLLSPRPSGPTPQSACPSGGHTTPRGNSGIAAAASRYTAAPLPASLAAPAGQQAAAADQRQQTRWSLHGDGGLDPTLRRMTASITLLAEDVVGVAGQPLSQAYGGVSAVHSAVAGFLRAISMWLARLVQSLHTALSKLLGRVEESSSSSAASVGSRQVVQSAIVPIGGPMLPAARRTSAGATAAATSSSSTPLVRNRAGQPQQLVATRQGPAAKNSTQHSFPFHVPVLALAASAVLWHVGNSMWRRWQYAMQRQHDLEQLIACNQIDLSRQKQRLHRALAVDSVLLELPAIKETDVQPGPVPVSEILARQAQSPQQAKQQQAASQRSGQQAQQQQHAQQQQQDDSLRQWNKFMAASRTSEVKDVSGSNGSGAARAGHKGGSSSASHSALSNNHAGANPNNRPFNVTDQRELADMSERIRRANEPGVGGAAAAAAAAQPIVISYDQLYIDAKESDEEAMARRAAERKARWAKQQEQQQPASGAARQPKQAATGNPAPARGPPPPNAAAKPLPPVPPLPLKERVPQLATSAPLPAASAASPLPGRNSAAGAEQARVRPDDDRASTQAARAQYATAQRPGQPASAGNPFAASAETGAGRPSSSPPTSPGAARSGSGPATAASPGASRSSGVASPMRMGPAAAPSRESVDDDAAGSRGNGGVRWGSPAQAPPRREAAVAASAPSGRGSSSGGSPVRAAETEAPMAAASAGPLPRVEGRGRLGPQPSEDVGVRASSPPPADEREVLARGGAAGSGAGAGAAVREEAAAAAALRLDLDSVVAAVGGARQAPVAGTGGEPSGAAAVPAAVAAAPPAGGDGRSNGALRSHALDVSAANSEDEEEEEEGGESSDAGQQPRQNLLRHDGLAGSSAGGRSKRAPAAGELKRPDTAAPGLVRLMRRPTGPPAAAAGAATGGAQQRSGEAVVAEAVRGASSSARSTLVALSAAVFIFSLAVHAAAALGPGDVGPPGLGQPGAEGSVARVPRVSTRWGEGAGR